VNDPADPASHAADAPSRHAADPRATRTTRPDGAAVSAHEAGRGAENGRGVDNDRDAEAMDAAVGEDCESREEQSRRARRALGLPAEALPRHIAIIMDGNGRWAREQGKPRPFGHDAGARNVRPIVTECARLGLDALTLYSFSTENWSRPSEEIDFLMDLYATYLREERQVMMDNDVRFVQLGRREGLDPRVLEELDRTREATAANQGLTLALALNYGSRREVVDGVRRIAERVKAGELNPDDIDESTISDHLYTAGLPDPDLLVRTAGEMRISNYLLWQISYAEFHVTPVCWPDFSLDHLREAVHEFARRQRRFGRVLDSSKDRARGPDSARQPPSEQSQ